ncbi:MAG: hypothetical protein AABZ06_07110 [Bdellovibrionota bacterium]
MKNRFVLYGAVFLFLCSVALYGADVFKIDWTATTDKGLVIKAPASQSANLQEWQDSSGSAVSSVNSSGQITLGDSSKGVNKFLKSDSNGLGSWSAMYTITGAAKNLVVKYDSATQVIVTADEIVLKDSSNVSYFATSVNVTAAITSSGANGLDTGSEASSTWYYVWVIYNGTTVASLLSTSATAPTMPSGYTYKVRAGSVYNDASSNFERFYQIDRTAYYYAYSSALSAGSATVMTSVSLTALVPPIAVSAIIMAYCAGDDVSQILAGMCSIGYDGTNSIAFLRGRYKSTYTCKSKDTQTLTVPLATAQTIYYSNNSAYLDFYLYVSGYTIP